MPFAAPRPCSTPGCRALVHGGTRCPAHARHAHAEDRAERGSAHERGYTSRWQKYRLTYLTQHPLCVDCGSRGIIEPARVVDHVRAHKGDHVLFWDPKNHRALCKRCHDQRTDEGDFGRAAR